MKPTLLPYQPRLFIGREKNIDEVKRKLGVYSIRDRESLIVIRGWPGVGKTTFVNALAYDKDVQESYFGGILWGTLGESDNISGVLSSWGKELGVPDLINSSSLEAMAQRLQAIIRNRSFLVIVDDVWTVNGASILKRILGENTTLIFTTRFTRLALELADRPDKEIYNLKELDDSSALKLLYHIAQPVVEQYEKESQHLVKALEGLPLAIRVAGKLLVYENSMGLDSRPLFTELQNTHRLMSELAPDDRFDVELELKPTIGLLFKKSTDRLDEETRRAFARLAVFAPKPATFDLRAMKEVLELEHPMQIARRLIDHGILEPIPEMNRFQLHALLVMYAHSILESM